MSIDTAVLLGFFALAGVVTVCCAWIMSSLLTARIQIEQHRTEQAYHLAQAERLRVEALRNAAMLTQEQRALAEVQHVTR